MKTISILTILLFQFSNLFAQCTGSEPVVFLGNDTTLCPGQSLTLHAPNGYDNYLWSNSSTQQSITVSSPGTYTLTSTLTSVGPNLVVNGNFNAGATGFISDYVPGTGGTWGLLSNPGQYAISTSPHNVHNNFYVCGDHTTGTGNMFIANGSDIPNTVVWSQTINVIPNTNYNFSTWATSVENTTNPAILQFFVNNIQIGNVFSPSLMGCDWSQFSNVWNSGSSTSAVITIKNQNIDGAGNDFALDDIEFTSSCVNTDAIVVSIDTTIVNAGPDLSFCSNVPEYLVGTSNNSTALLGWNTGVMADSIIPDTSGVYIFSTTTNSGCTFYDTAVVTIHPTPVAIMAANPSVGIVPLSVNFSNSSQNASNYAWDFGNGLNAISTDTSSVSSIYTEAGTFWVTLVASNAFCTDSVTLTIVVTDPVSLETPNVFTPNNDGKNDVYRFDMVNIIELDLKIVNRWGEVMYTTTDVSASWDGKDNKGNVVSDGLYFYTYTAKGLQNTSFKGQGFIQLIK